MMENDFVIPLSRLPLLKQYQSRIASLFSVVFEDIPISGNIVVGSRSHIWIRLKSCAGDRAQQQQQQDVQFAKEYILSLVSEEACRPQTETYSPKNFHFLKQYHDQIEANARAILSFDDSNYSVNIYGLYMNQMLAQSYMCHRLEKSGSEISSFRGASPEKDSVRIKSRGDQSVVRTRPAVSPTCMSPGADSCYGSSDDCLTEWAGQVSSAPPPLPSRSTKPRPAIPKSPPHSPISSTSSDPELEKIQSDSSYISKVEFGVKLGYSESQVLLCLQKLGIGAPQNELLSELITLGTCKPNTVKQTGKLEQIYDSFCGINDSVKAEQLMSAMSRGDNFEKEGEGTTHPEEDEDEGATESPLSCDSRDSIYRHIVIDGSNVAMSHGNKEVFSCRGIQLAVDWFRNKGCQDITVFVPQWRKENPRPDAPILDQHILTELEKQRILAFTPARRISGKRVVCYDDRYVLNLASQDDGIVVSNDNYRDLLAENKDYKKVVEERLLMYSFVRDMFMPPDDPLGRHGPSLENFLRKEPTMPEKLPPPCPYGKKCTYGNKCKYYHPERGSHPQKSVTEKLAEQAKQEMQEVKDRNKASEDRKKVKKQKQVEKRVLTRTDSSSVSYGEPLVPPPRPPRRPIGQARHTDILDVEYDEGNEEYKAYNEKLTLLRKNIQLQDIKNQTEPLPSVPDVNLEAPPPIGYVESSSWSTGPEVNQARNNQGREQLVTGHLAVAQTLSDEANRENHQKRAAQVLKQQEELKQALSRQPYLFVASQDDMHHLNHKPVRQNLDGHRQVHSLPLTLHQGDNFSSNHAVSQGQFYNIPNQNLISRSPFDNVFLTDRSGVSQSGNVNSSRSSFSRTPGGQSNMTRQNSTSDPLLNKHSGSQNLLSTQGMFPGMYAERQPTHYQPTSHLPANPFVAQSNTPLSYPYYQAPNPHQLMTAPVESNLPVSNWPPTAGYAAPPESGFPADRDIPVSDERYNLYYHLCGIFPDHQVLTVMNRYPQETNPRVLVMHIMSLNG